MRAYYEAVRTGQYAIAWKLGGKNLGRSYESFVEGYANTTAQALGGQLGPGKHRGRHDRR